MEDIFKSLSESVSEECFEDILSIIEEIISESNPASRQALVNARKAEYHNLPAPGSWENNRYFSSKLERARALRDTLNNPKSQAKKAYYDFAKKKAYANGIRAKNTNSKYGLLGGPKVKDALDNANKEAEVARKNYSELIKNNIK